MHFITKKTTELTREEKSGMVDLFNAVFKKKRTVDEFNRQFLNNSEGFSFHTFAWEDNKIVASNTMVPSIYLVSGRPSRFVNSVDTMIAEHYRGLENFYDLIQSSFTDARERGFDAVYGFPNDNSYELFTKLKFMKDVGSLDTYCLPYRVGGIKKGLGWLNWMSMAFCRLWTCGAAIFSSAKPISFLIEKDASSYNATRYRRSDGIYSVIDGLFAYKIMSYNGVRTAFIIDVFDKSARNFVKSVSYLYKHEQDRFDLVLYVGHLLSRHHGLIPIPRRFEPKHFHFTAELFSKDIVDRKSFFLLDNWDVNLSNYDII